MRVVILGAKGILGVDLLEACRAAGFKTIGYDIDRLDVSDFTAVKNGLPTGDWVINCAGYSNVDEAEVDRERAYAINAEGARNVARVCTKKRIKLAHISTDFVFDGSRRRPYVETDQTNPINRFGASKLAGEKAVRSEGGEYLVIRSPVLFGKGGDNVVRTIAQQLKAKKDGIQVVDDQVTAPTYTRHLAEAVLRLLQQSGRGVVHVAASRECSWYDFAVAIAERVEPCAKIQAVQAEASEQRAVRPAYSVLDTQKYRMLTGHVMPTWEQGLTEYVEEEGF